MSVRAKVGDSDAFVVDRQAEAVEADAGDQFDPVGRLELGLGIDGGDGGAGAVVGVAGGAEIFDPPRGGRLVEGDRAIGIEEAGRQALVAAGLAADFEAEEPGLVDPGKAAVPHEVGLADQISAIVAAVVGAEIDRAGRADRAAGEDVRVEFVIIRDLRAVAQQQVVAELLFDPQAGDLDVGIGDAVGGIAEEGAVIAFERAAACRRNAAIGGAAVVEIFVGEVDAGVLSRLPAERRVDAVALQLGEIAEAVAMLPHAVHAQAERARQGHIVVGGEAGAAFAVVAEDELAVVLEAGALGDAVDDPAAAAAAEDHRVGAFEYLDPVEIVEVAEILGVVAQAVDEEIGGGVVAAQGQLVAIGLAGAGRRAGNEHQEVGDRAQRLVLDLRFGHDRDRLGHVAQRGEGLSPADGRLDPIFLAAAGDGDDLSGILLGDSCLRIGRRKRPCRGRE